MSNDQTTALTLARDALRKLPQFVVTETVESCNGNKCRERWCCGCSGEDEAASAIAESFDALAAGTKALAAIDQALADRARQAPAPVEVSRLADIAKEAMNSAYHHGRAHLTVREDHAHTFANAWRDELLEAIASMASTPVGEVPAIDYNAAIAHAFKTLKAAQGTKACVAFARGAEWFRDQCLAASPAPAASKGAEADDPYEEESLGALILSNQSQNAPFGECPFCKSAIRGVHTQACRDRAAPSEPEAQKAVAQPIGYMSLEQQVLIRDPEGESGVYIPLRATPAGKFTMPLYASPSPAASMEVQGQMLMEAEQVAAERLARKSPGRWENVFSEAIQRALAAKNGWRLGEGRG